MRVQRGKNLGATRRPPERPSPYTEYPSGGPRAGSRLASFIFTIYSRRSVIDRRETCLISPETEYRHIASRHTKAKTKSHPPLSTVGRFTERYPVHTVSFSSRVPGEAPALRHANLSGCPAHIHAGCSHQIRHHGTLLLLSSVRLSPVHVHVSRWHSRTRFDVPRSFDPHTAPAAFSRMWDSYVPYRPERPCLPDRVLGGPRPLSLSLTAHP